MGEAAYELELVLDRYRPIRPLGSGGSGSVWLARDEHTGLDVSLKVVSREGKAASRAEREVEAAMRLRHERCQRAYALEQDGAHVYIAYEYVPGRTLRQAMRAGELPDAAALEAAAQVLEALAHAHSRGIVHRDVKPANILLVEGPGVAVKLLDFGLAQIHGAQTLTATGDVPGTLAYISPERLKGDEGGPASDVWAVGVLLWEALAGRHPFWASSLTETATMITDGAPPLAAERPDLPRPVLAAVSAALALDPRKRPQARELAEVLRKPRREKVAQSHKVRNRIGKPSARLPLSLVAQSHKVRGAARFGGAGAAGVAAGWVASTLAFFPSGWPLGIAAAVALLSTLRPWAGAALALAVPVLPLGNLAAGAAVAYGAAALALGAGLRLAPPAPRRALAAAAATVGAYLAVGVDARFPGEEEPLAVAGAVAGALPPAAFALAALAAAVAVALPHAPRLGRWSGAAVGGALAAAAAVPALPALPLLAAAWALALGLWAVGEH